MQKVVSSQILFSVLSPDFIGQIFSANFNQRTRSCLLLHHGFNDTYLVQTEKEDFIFRLYRQGWRSGEQIKSELDILTALQNQKQPVSVPISTDTKKTLIEIETPEGKRFGVAFTKAKGNLPLALDPNTAFKYGKILAGLHNAFDQVPVPAHRPQLEANQLIDQALLILREFHGDSFSEGLEYLESRFGEFKIQLSKTNDDSGLIHGDFITANSAIDQRGEITIFDFDFCGYGSRLYDLATLKWQLRVSQSDKENDLFETILNGYRSERPTDFKESHLEYLIWVRQLWVWTINLKYGTDFRRLNEHGFHHRVSLFQKWDQEIR